MLKADVRRIHTRRKISNSKNEAPIESTFKYVDICRDLWFLNGVDCRQCKSYVFVTANLAEDML
jgi:hypothetical protein